MTTSIPHPTDSPAGSRPLFGDAGLSLDAEEAAELGIWRWDLDSDTVDVSERLLSIIGFGSGRFDGTPQELFEFVHPDDRDRVWSELRSALAQHRPFSWQARINRPDGGQRTVLSQGSPSDTATGHEVVAVCADISSGDSSESTTGRLERRITHIIANSSAMICITDLDHRYRIVNNATVALTGVPMDKLIGHTASEAIPVIGPAIDAQAAKALRTMETVHCDIELPAAGETRIFHLISFVLTDHAGAPAELCSMADDVTDSRRREVAARLRRATTTLIDSALAEDRLVAVRQPVVDISSDATVSEELLVRMALPQDRGLLQPRSFLPAAERFGLVQQVDLWMLGQALGVARTRRVQVNLSAVTFSDRAARAAIIAALERAPEAARRIVFEITETAAAEHIDAAAAFAQALTGMGCGLALDDFGTGFGSFTYLRRLPLCHLKIDRSFVTGLAGSEDDRKVVASIIGIAQQFGLCTIAEGVEDSATFEVLRDIGADCAQGFFLGRPGPLI